MSETNTDEVNRPKVDVYLDPDGRFAVITEEFKSQENAVVEPAGNKKPRSHGELTWALDHWAEVPNQPHHVDQGAAKKWLADELTAGRLGCGHYTLLRVVAEVNPSIRTVSKVVL